MAKVKPYVKTDWIPSETAITRENMMNIENQLGEVTDALLLAKPEDRTEGSIAVRNANGEVEGDLAGNSASTSKFDKKKLLKVTGVVNGQVQFDGSEEGDKIEIATTLDKGYQQLLDQKLECFLNTKHMQGCPTLSVGQHCYVINDIVVDGSRLYEVIDYAGEVKLDNGLWARMIPRKTITGDLNDLMYALTEKILEGLNQLEGVVLAIRTEKNSALTAINSDKLTALSDIALARGTALGTLEQYMHAAENGGNANSVQGYVPRNFKRTEDTIADLVSSASNKYHIGDVVELNGYYTAGDGAGHKRKIAETDDGSGVQLANGLWANIVHNGEVNVSWFGAKGDGVTDDTVAIQKAIKLSSSVSFSNCIYNISNTILFAPYKTLKFDKTTFKYVGTKNKTTILCGSEVGESPNVPVSKLRIYGELTIDCNNLTDFGFYGTYITNQSTIQGIVSKNSLECGIFIAKSWFASYINIHAIGNRNHGIVLGRSFTMTSGVEFSLQGSNQYEINACVIQNISSHTHNTGAYVSDNLGIGIDIGLGHNMVIRNSQSEKGEVGIGYRIKRDTTYSFCLDGFYSERNRISVLIDTSTNIDSQSLSIKNGFVSSDIKQIGLKKVNIFLENITPLNSEIRLTSEVLDTFYTHKSVSARFNNIINKTSNSYVTLQRDVTNVRYFYKNYIPQSEDRRVLKLLTKTDFEAGGAISFINKEGTVISSRNIPALKAFEEHEIIVPTTAIFYAQAGGSISADKEITFYLGMWTDTIYGMY